MANKLYEEQHIQDIANAIREKTGKTDSLLVSAMAEEIEGITTKSDPVLQDKTVTENGEVVADEGYDGLGTVTVDVVEDLTDLVDLLGDGEVIEGAEGNIFDELAALIGGDANTVEAQIQSLIDSANTTTGNQDTNLTDGVNALVSGFGQGGSSGGISISCSTTSRAISSTKVSDTVSFTMGVTITETVS